MNFGKVQKRRGIGTVITTLIILIASVVLGAGVIFFGGSLFQTNTETEAVQVTNEHIWVNSTSSQAAFVIQNTGGKVVSVNTISIRGTSVPISQWYFNNDPTLTAADVQTELQKDNDGTQTAITVNGSSKTFAQATGPISLKQGQAAIVYLSNPAGIKSIDSGLSFNMNILAGKASAVKSVSVING